MFRTKRIFLILSLIFIVISITILPASFSKDVQAAYTRVHSFSPAANYPVGNNPIGEAVGDIMGLGHQDLVVANEIDSTITVLANNGNGIFTPQTPLPTGNGPVGLIIGDLAGLGHQDLAVTNIVDNTVSIYFNNGHGVLTLQTSVPVGRSPLGIAIGDFMGLGHQDLAVSNLNNNTVTILANNGSGVFTAQTPIPVAGGPIKLVTGNFMGLGHPDLAVSDTSDNTVSILANNGSGIFTVQPSIAVGSTPQWITAGDFMGLGHPDLAVANSGDNTVSVLANNGSGVFTAQTPIPVGFNPIGIIGGDFIGLGKRDIATTDFGDNVVSILLNTSTTSGTPTPTTTPSTAICGAVIDADQAPAICNTLIALDVNPGSLTNQVPAEVTFTSNNVRPAGGNNAHPSIASTGLDQVVDFQFTNNVIDTRNTQAGWSLAAQSTGLTSNNGGPAITDISLTGDLPGSTCDITTVCTPPITNLIPGTNLILNATAQTFMQAPTGGTGVANHGNYHILATGSFTVPAAAVAGSTYSGVITVTLTNAAS